MLILLAFMFQKKACLSYWLMFQKQAHAAYAVQQYLVYITERDEQSCSAIQRDAIALSMWAFVHTNITSVLVSALSLQTCPCHWFWDAGIVDCAMLLCNYNAPSALQVKVQEPGGPEENYDVTCKWAATVDIRALTQFVA